MTRIWLDGELIEEVELSRCDVCAALTLLQERMLHWELAHWGDN